MKKIIFYTDTPIYGGAEKQMLLLAKNLPKEKYQIQLICNNHKSLQQWIKEWEKQHIKVHKLPKYHKHDIRNYFQIKKILKQEKPDLVHIHIWNPASARYAITAIDKKNTKLITTEHDPFQLHGIKNKIKKHLIKKIDTTITVSNANKKLLQTLYPEIKNKITTIHNGIEIQEIEKQISHAYKQQKEKIKQQLNTNKNDLLIISIGTLHQRKGYKYLINAFSTINKKYPNTHLAIIGEGPERKKLEKQIKQLNLQEKITMPGFKQNITQILLTSDIFVLPSIKEAFGLVLLEALTTKTPIIASNTGGIPEIIQNKKTGLLFTPKDEKELTNKLEQLITNKALREKLTYLGHHSIKKFTAKEMARKTDALYNKILQIK